MNIVDCYRDIKELFAKFDIDKIYVNTFSDHEIRFYVDKYKITDQLKEAVRNRAFLTNSYCRIFNYEGVRASLEYSILTRMYSSCDDKVLSTMFNLLEKSEILKIIECEGYDTIIGLFERGINMDIEDSNGYTPLMYAVYRDCVYVDTLLKLGSDPNHESSNNSPLIIALKNLKMFEILVKYKANVYYKYRNGQNILAYINDHTDDRVIEFLAINYPDLTDEFGDSLLHIVTKLHLVEFLLDHGFDINKVDLRNNTALINACADGNVAIVKLLLERHADISIRCIFQYTAIDYAHEPEIIDSLCEAIHRIQSSLAERLLEIPINSRIFNYNNPWAGLPRIAPMYEIRK